jgi:hypothetical protein
MSNLDKLSECEFQPDIFVDLTNGQDIECDRMAKEKVASHHDVMFRYFRSHYKLKKVDEFASTFPGYNGSLEELMKFFQHTDLDGYFRVKLGEVTSVDDTEEEDPEIRAIVDLGMSPLDTFVEIVTQKTFNTRSRNHKSLLASLCGLGRENGFLMGGRGRKRKYVFGNELLELLVQLAVVDYKPKKGVFITRPIVITDFVEWLKSRYGILIDRNNGAEDSPERSKALENNYTALKSRLRQLGFYVDLSDASNSQVIRPRFPDVDILIMVAKPKAQPTDAKGGTDVLEKMLVASSKARFGCWTNGIETLYFQKKKAKFDTNIFPVNDFPRKGESDSSIFTTDRSRLRIATGNNLLYAFKRCHDYIHANQGGSKEQIFWEFLKILFATRRTAKSQRTD